MINRADDNISVVNAVNNVVQSPRSPSYSTPTTTIEARTPSPVFDRVKTRAHRVPHEVKTEIE